MTPPLFAFRCDAGPAVGAGHAFRCLTLADALSRRGAACAFLTRSAPERILNEIAARGHAVRRIGDDARGRPHGRGDDWIVEDALGVRETLAAMSPRRLIVDHYDLDAEWERSAALGGSPVMAIDDLANRPHACDLLLDQNLGRTEKDYDGLLPDGAARLVGAGYAMVRPEFVTARPASLERRSERRELRKLLVSMGGFDGLGAARAVIERIAERGDGRDIEIVVLAGFGAPDHNESQPTRRRKGVDVQFASDPNCVVDRMADADLAIAAAGGASWERCCLGLPSWVVTVADNQRAAARALCEAGAAVMLGDAREAHWLEKLDALLAEAALTDPAMSIAAAKLVDGLGVERVADRIMELDR